MDSEYYSINAKAADEANPGLMNGRMLQALLKDRLKLKIHRETRQGPGYALTGAKGGHKLQPFQGGVAFRS